MDSKNAKAEALDSKNAKAEALDKRAFGVHSIRVEAKVFLKKKL